MKKFIFLLFIIPLLFLFIFHQEVLASNLKGKVNISAIVDSNIEEDINIVIERIDTTGDNVENFILSKNNNYKKNISLLHGKYSIKIINSDSFHQEYYNIVHDDFFNVTSNLEEVKIYIKEKEKEKEEKTGWVNFNIECSYEFNNTIMIYLIKDDNRKYSCKVSKNNNTFYELAFGKYKIVDAIIEFDEDSFYDVEYVDEFYLNEDNLKEKINLKVLVKTNNELKVEEEDIKEVGEEEEIVEIVEEEVEEHKNNKENNKKKEDKNKEQEDKKEDKTKEQKKIKSKDNKKIKSNKDKILLAIVIIVILLIALALIYITQKILSMYK